MLRANHKVIHLSFLLPGSICTANRPAARLPCPVRRVLSVAAIKSSPPAPRFPSPGPPAPTASSTSHPIPDSATPAPAPAPAPAQPSFSPAPPQAKKIPIIVDELDIEEAFVKGSGPGGQKINKCRHRVQLRHIPTNIRVESQRFRDLASNRKEARKLLTLKLDELHNGDLSKRAVRIALEQKRKKRAAQKSRKKLSKSADEADEADKADGDDHLPPAATSGLAAVVGGDIANDGETPR
ncbi:hypothetical protein HDU87_005317 [Geranomyces variabilis]|uniref:Prokaryotic-type class I peptide chain release factors domain-containing protein n=1 Tax=Geranomyces variabilis TaxID=109894 RepID=A0AAD5TIW4_9FUNG|nr:hypothetical protein HDU87_005317 [Geranomyces variabilis]